MTYNVSSRTSNPTIPYSVSKIMLIKTPIRCMLWCPATDAFTTSGRTIFPFFIICLMALLLFLCQVTGCTVSDPVTAAVQASASLHPRRGWCGSRSVSYSEHRSDAQNTFPSFTGIVHLRQSKAAIQLCATPCKSHSWHRWIIVELYLWPSLNNSLRGNEEVKEKLGLLMVVSEIWHRVILLPGLVFCWDQRLRP